MQAIVELSTTLVDNPNRGSTFQILTTCSPRNFALVKSYGTDVVFDYNDPDCGWKIRKYTNDKLKFVEDCITDEDISMPTCAAAVLSDGIGAKYYAFIDFEDCWPRDDVELNYTMAYTCTGKELRFGDEDVPVRTGE
jgi:NADPH:quinone reductase-like Zn-dependent oxidoreductase